MTIREEMGRVADALETWLRRQEEDRRERERREYQEYFDAHKGRRELRRLTLVDIMESIPGMAGLFRTSVPDEFWIEDKGMAVVSCPCGETPAVPREGMLCCSCDRSFVFTGSQVRVWRDQEAPSGVN